MSLYPASIVCSFCDGPMVHSRLSSRCRCNDKEPRFKVGEFVKVKDKDSFYCERVAKVKEITDSLTPDHFRIYRVAVGNVTFCVDEYNLHYYFGS